MNEKTTYLGPLLAADMRQAEIRKRRSPYVFKTASLATYPGYVEDGWSVAKKSKKSVRLSQPKRGDERLEDEIFCLLADMGFGDLSAGRRFKIAVSDTAPPKQIDVFAADDDFAIVVECKTKEQLGGRRMQEVIGELSSHRQGIIRALKGHYGRDASRKTALVLATRNIDWSEQDVLRAKEQNIHILNDFDIDYYKQLAQHLGVAARYQLAAQLFVDQEISNLGRSVAANRGSMGGKTFYTFLINPAHLLKIAYISHKRPGDAGALDTYQRMLSKKRLQEVADFIDAGGKFPTNIVVNIRNPRGIRYDQKEALSDASFGVLELPKKYGSCWVIDGQHRLYAYALAKDPKAATVSVLAFTGLSPQEQATLFVDINDKQKRVPKTLLVDLFSDLYASSNDPEERLDAISSKVVKGLNSAPSSPIRGRIVVAGDKKDRFRCLALASLNEELLKTNLLGEVRDQLFRPGPLTVGDKVEPTLRRAGAVLAGYLNIFATECSEQWAIGDGEGGYLCTNNAIRALLRVLKEICNKIDREGSLRCEDLSEAELLAKVRVYAEPLARHFSGANSETLRSYRMLQGSAGQRAQAMKMMLAIRDAVPSFSPDGLDDFLATQDVAANGKASAIITDLQRTLFEFVIAKLKQAHGDAWWKEGVPLRIRTDCVQRREEDPDNLDPEQYLYLKDYISIAANNWTIFAPYFSLLEKGGKDAQLDWMQKINKIRNKTMHPERGLVSQAELQFVRDHNDLFVRKLELDRASAA